MTNTQIELRDIPGFEGRYAATEDGRIWSHLRNKFLKSCGDPDDYQIVYLRGKPQKGNYYVHRLVAMAWLPNPDNLPQVNHKDEHKDNNSADNLEWCTSKYNLSYGRCANRRHIPVRCIELDKTYPSMYEAAKAMGGNAPNLHNCVRGKQKTFAGYHWELA